MSAHPKLIELLKANIGKPLTANLAADICMSAAGRQRRPFPLSNEFGSAEYRNIVFRVESMVDVLDEIKGLHSKHWGETEGYRAELGFEPDYEQYVAIDREGTFILVTARAEAKMVGYFMFVLYTSRHSSKYVAAEDAFYLDPAHRKGFALVTLMRFSEACLKKLGVNQITLAEKVSHPIAPVLKRSKFQHVGNLWIKVI